MNPFKVKSFITFIIIISIMFLIQGITMVKEILEYHRPHELVIIIIVLITFVSIIITQIGNYDDFQCLMITIMEKDILATMERPPDLPPSRSADYCTKKSFFQVLMMMMMMSRLALTIRYLQNFTRKPSFKQLVRSSSDGTDTPTNGSSPHSKSPSHKTSPSHSNQGKP